MPWWVFKPLTSDSGAWVAIILELEAAQPGPGWDLVTQHGEQAMQEKGKGLMTSCQLLFSAWSLPPGEKPGLRGWRLGFSPSSEIHFTCGFGQISFLSGIQVCHLFKEGVGLDGFIDAH